MLGYRDIGSMLGVAKDTTAWELWNVEKGIIPKTDTFSSRVFWTKQLRDQVLQGIGKRYNAELGPLETRIIHDIVGIAAAEIRVKGDLPVENATHLILRMSSKEAFDFNYFNNGEQITPPLDLVHATLVQSAFGTTDVAIFILVGNGESERVIEIGPNPFLDIEIDQAIKTFKRHLDENEEPAPDFQLDSKTLQALAASSAETALEHFRGDSDEEFVTKVNELSSLNEQTRALDQQVRTINKKKDVVRAFIANRLRGYSHATIGNHMVRAKRITRNVPAYVTEYTQIEIK
ncbi:hypothetical protein [Microvirga tunisiensis]|uniref:YqaJ viral recombinase domain-containing protein n=1 Tax=Microvirga tunisiensis TaxID=2108360 RepID=A0A5N7MC96_9HYPH|nr:hypothetical protein [Microvirga tunisiensis]MPR05679.1 hypothetical protein [Microvirga tunisiensis]MPR23879.1 hypothetical protein [Microvirga tunisiensis]